MKRYVLYTLFWSASMEKFEYINFYCSQLRFQPLLLLYDLISDEYDTVIATAWQLSIILGKVKRLYSRSFRTIAWEHSSYEAYFERKYFYLYNNTQLFADNLRYVDSIVVLNNDYKEKYLLKAI